MKKTFLLLITILFVFYSFSQNIGIGTTTPNTSAMLEIKATSKGILIPRMTGAERTATINPVEGLMVYDSTDRNVYIYKRLQGGWKKADFDLPYAGTDNNAISFQVNNVAPAASFPIGILGRHSNAAIGLALPAAVYGVSNLNNGIGVIGESSTSTGIGVYGTGQLNGVFGFSFNNAGTRGNSTNGYGVYGVSTNSVGVYGMSNAPAPIGIGMFGSGNGYGVWGSSPTGNGVFGESPDGIGMRGTSTNGYAVYGVSTNSIGVFGQSNAASNGIGVEGFANGVGIYGITSTATGVGVLGQNTSTTGKTISVRGIASSNTDTTAGVWGEVTNTSLNFKAFGVIGKSVGNGGGGVMGFTNGAGVGVLGFSEFATGVLGESNGGAGVWGKSVANGWGVVGEGWGNNSIGVRGSTQGYINTVALLGECHGPGSVAVSARALGSALYGLSASNVFGTAAFLRANSTSDVEQLLLEEDGNDYTRIKFRNTSNAPVWVLGAYPSPAGLSTGARFNIYYNNLNNGSGGDAFSLDGNGNLTIAGNAFKPGGGAWNIPSDARLKKDVVDFNDGLSVINKIRPVSYHYNGLLNLPTEQAHVGVIAQELKQVAPYMVQKMTGNEEYLQVDPNAMTYLLINAVKELDRENKELKKELALIKEMLSCKQ